MAQTVSNDALWEKLSEIDNKLDNISAVQKTPVSITQQTEDKPDLYKIKEDIIREIKLQVGVLGTHSDINFKADRQYLQSFQERVLKILKVIHLTIKEQKEPSQLKEENKESYFNLRFLKIRKTTLIITLLSLLIFLLTLFCMKQQNDYSLLIHKYYRQEIITQEQNKESILE